jgi:hypothetical protein
MTDDDLNFAPCCVATAFRCDAWPFTQQENYFMSTLAIRYDSDKAFTKTAGLDKEASWLPSPYPGIVECWFRDALRAHVEGSG